MCGRIACALDPNVICCASTYKDNSSGKFKRPTWRDHPSPKDPTSGSCTYYPSANAAPTRFTPVMYKPKQEETDANETVKTEEGDSSDYVISPMMFGMIPVFHKGEAKSHGLSTNNCRLEGMLESKLYKRVLQQRKLCVVVAQGFYEWKTVGAEPKKSKQPYLIFAPQEGESAKVADDSAWENGEWNENEGWKGPRILKMAGLYDIWKSPAGDEIYSYTVITMGSNETLSWLHDRMPAILETEEQVQGWLNATAETDTNELISILKPAKVLQWYPVDSKVGNSRCHDKDCMQPLVVKENKSKTFMDNWLKRQPADKSASDDEQQSPSNPDKKPKLE